MKIVDLFAGPGGLGEGFSAFLSNEGSNFFEIALSIEKEPSAKNTLMLRSIFRNLQRHGASEPYYSFMKGELGSTPEEELYRIPELSEFIELAKEEVAQFELGKISQKLVYEKIRTAIGKDEFILVGGPPCQAYSLAGRSKNLSAGSNYDPDSDNRNFLYREYLKIIGKWDPLESTCRHASLSIL